MTKNNTAIHVKNVVKTFRIPHEKRSTLKSVFVNPFKKQKYEKQTALKDVSFDVKQGEFFGIVGRNGSGKSTLLKVIAQIYSSDKGDVEIAGSLTPFIELGVGFNPELSGKENVYLNGALLGFTRSEVEEMYDDIVEFSELERFMDQKLKNYSSGMQVRLAFSIAIKAQSDILLLDEVLAVGDASFQRKCYDYFLKLKRDGQTVVLVTHDMSAVQRFCDRAMVLSQGKSLGIFKPHEAALKYDELNKRTDESDPQTELVERGSKEVVLTKVQYKNKTYNPGSKVVAKQGDDFSITCSIQNKIKKPYIVGMAFYDEFGTNMAGPNTEKHKLTGSTVTFTAPKLSFNPGNYRLMFVIYDQKQTMEYDYYDAALTIEVPDLGHQTHGKINLFEQWEFK